MRKFLKVILLVIFIANVSNIGFCNEGTTPAPAACDSWLGKLFNACNENPELTKAIKENPALIDSFKKLDDAGINDVIKNNPDVLKQITKWSDDGISVAPDMSSNSLKLFGNNGGGKIAEMSSDGKLIPSKYDFDPSTQKYRPNGTPIGEPQNGYQMFKHGDDISVRRVPDKSGYSETDLNKLTEHPRAHVLERHGHDVTDEALVKRANEGVAPDGSSTYSGNAPPYSSKFENTEKLKEALNNTKPGTGNFNPPSNGNSYAFDYPASGQASTPFGYGIPSGGDISSSVQMYRVKVVYKKQNGVWKLLTMYPQP